MTANLVVFSDIENEFYDKTANVTEKRPFIQ